MWRRVAFPLSLLAAVGAAAFAASSLSAAPAVSGRSASKVPGGPHYSIGCNLSHQNNDTQSSSRASRGARITTRSSETGRSMPGRRRPRSAMGPPGSDLVFLRLLVPEPLRGRPTVEPYAAIVLYVKRSRGMLAKCPEGAS